MMFPRIGKRPLFTTITKCSNVRRLSSKLTAVQVSILGADTKIGVPTCVLLKQNPIVSILHIQGAGKIKGMAADLRCYDTRCQVRKYPGNEKIPDSIKGADVVVILGYNTSPRKSSVVDVLMTEGKRLKRLVKNCTLYSPKAIIIVCVPPISVSLPIAALVFKKTHWYHPGRLIGFSGLPQIMANSQVARFHDLDASTVHVPMIGGPDVETAVPLFSRAFPATVNPRDRKFLLAQFRGIRDDEFPNRMSKPQTFESNALAQAFALNRMITMIGLGICGDPSAVTTGFVRTNILGTCKHLVTEVRFARSGVVHNFGIPKIAKIELKLLERAALTLKERERLAAEFIRHTDAEEADELAEKQDPPFKVKQDQQRKSAKRGVAI